MRDTIFALSSGSPPAAIGVVRISGPDAGLALEQLAGREFEPRRASVANLYDVDGQVLDMALVLWFPGPNTSTGEDLVELHCHGGRAVVDAVETALGKIAGLRPAQPGEFTRRSFANGRIDLAQAEGLSDLLAAETELQRNAAVAMAGGAFSRTIEGWRDRVLHLSAQLEAALDFSDEDDVDELPPSFGEGLQALRGDLSAWLNRPRAEKLGEGVRVVLAGPPNTGKSTLFNALTESEAAITSPIAGTTRDVIERAVAIDGVPFLFIDTAGMRDESGDAIEQIGIERAQGQVDAADIVLWLGGEGEGPEGVWEVAAKSDDPNQQRKSESAYAVSAVEGSGIDPLRAALVSAAREILPKPGEGALNTRQFELVNAAHDGLDQVHTSSDLLVQGEGLRTARLAFDRLIGRATTEDMLDALFGRFCIGK